MKAISEKFNTSTGSLPGSQDSQQICGARGTAALTKETAFKLRQRDRSDLRNAPQLVVCQLHCGYIILPRFAVKDLL